jgi:hypothetical protein
MGRSIFDEDAGVGIVAATALNSLAPGKETEPDDVFRPISRLSVDWRCSHRSLYTATSSSAPCAAANGRIVNQLEGFVGETVLITGGAGFIGRHVAKALLARGDRVRVLDSLIAQVHPSRSRPEELDPDVELLVGDVRD